MGTMGRADPIQGILLSEKGSLNRSLCGAFLTSTAFQADSVCDGDGHLDKLVHESPLGTARSPEAHRTF